MKRDTTKMAVDLFDEFAERYQEKYMDVGAYSESLDLFCRMMEKENASSLELACGPGNITRYLLERQPNWRILATDLSPKMLALAKQNNPSIECKLMDARSFLELKRSFDGLMCGFCFPYLSKKDVFQLIRNAALFLPPNGLFYFSTMEDDYEKSRYLGPSTGEDKRLFTYYHEADVLSKALIEHGFKIIHFERKDNGEDANDLIIIAKR